MSNSRSVTDENENTIEDSAASEMISKNTETGPAMNKQEIEENIPIESETTFVAPAPPATEPPVTESPATEFPVTEPLNLGLGTILSPDEFG